MTYSTKNKYTQRQWDRTVGWGKVSTNYSIHVDFEMKEVENEVQPPENFSQNKTEN